MIITWQLIEVFVGWKTECAETGRYETVDGKGCVIDVTETFLTVPHSVINQSTSSVRIVDARCSQEFVLSYFLKSLIVTHTRLSGLRDSNDAVSTSDAGGKNAACIGKIFFPSCHITTRTKRLTMQPRREVRNDISLIRAYQ